IVNMGTSGNTVRDLAARWDSDVVALSPDWLTICIGINDVWRQFDARFQVESFVTLDEYMRTLEDLIRTTRPQIKVWSL
ncbi:MAG TPA: GDSL-type esterase/lipase family protein, partial [Candidatus Limnocylindrales bacterium]|nr:GDSL-type esterase/lipase family protein [Candidatus Limnocylindrales bacterium]